MQRKSMLKEFWELFSPLVVRIVIAFIVEMIVIAIYPSDHIYNYINQIAALTALLTIPFLMGMMRRDQKKEIAVGIVPNKKAALSKYLLVIGISIPFSLGLNNILLLSNLAEYSVAYQEASESLYSSSLLVEIVCLGIIIPIMEELIFRGLMYKRLRRNRTPIRAMVSSAIFFGLYHGNAVQAIYALCAGVLLAYLYEKYGSIMAPILAHIMMNIVSCVLSEANVFTWMFSKMTRMTILTVLCAGIASSIFLFIRKIDEKPQSKNVEECV